MVPRAIASGGAVSPTGLWFTADCNVNDALSPGCWAVLASSPATVKKKSDYHMRDTRAV